MTEAEWLVCEDPLELLRSIRHLRTMRRRVKQRKQRLFAVACCRRLQVLLDDDRTRHCIEVAERYADDRATVEELNAAETDANELWLRDAADGARSARLWLCAKEVNERLISTFAIAHVFRRQREATNTPFEPLDGHRTGACPSEEQAQCELIREIFGNLFRKARVDPKWLSETVAALAVGIYEERAFDRMPILADALEEAGCDNAEVLSHCRKDGTHVRGCWVVDLVLAKA